jgi:hypothetical protein
MLTSRSGATKSGCELTKSSPTAATAKAAAKSGSIVTARGNLLSSRVTNQNYIYRGQTKSRLLMKSSVGHAPIEIDAQSLRNPQIISKPNSRREFDGPLMNAHRTSYSTTSGGSRPS